MAEQRKGDEKGQKVGDGRVINEDVEKLDSTSKKKRRLESRHEKYQERKKAKKEVRDILSGLGDLPFLDEPLKRGYCDWNDTYSSLKRPAAFGSTGMVPPAVPEFGRDTSRLDYFAMSPWNVDYTDTDFLGLDISGGGGRTQQVPLEVSSNNGVEAIVQTSNQPETGSGVAAAASEKSIGGEGGGINPPSQERQPTSSVIDERIHRTDRRPQEGESSVPPTHVTNPPQRRNSF
ncbi:hypothetical protein HanXRQr2_Chr16g0763141 [Helianthus annuus]|uniref:Uncharacterized protein n=1 Tax=Helianthus annuus TaxID=4232 RepID=A0A9K3GZ94_HELAN|nr:hypothetical protein HanXRQr2_Chr16g0763141 [Helianthus annuus]KAJ0444166.1 hypothetical protein HanIR_Chr16g0828831 [Helianthus annuus]KAJ0822372.1 hypothetical protein HanPSC8_Chr16g0731201 [Helianthus annuus]